MASAAVLGLIIEAENRASRALDTVTGDIDDMGDAADNANKKFASLKSAMGTGLKVAGAAAAAGVAAVGAVMVSSVRMAADAEEALSKFNVVFADTEGTAAAVTSEMDAFAKASGRNKYALREMAAGFGDVLKPMGFTVEEAGGLSTEMTQLAIDLGSFNNMRPEEAFERLSSTLIGNHANALSFGVIINEAVLKEELLAMGADDLTGALLEQAKVQARINILMRGTTDAQGDAIRTSDSWTNQMLRLNSVIDESRTALGLRLLPVFTPVLAAMTDLATKYVPMAADALASFVENLDTEAIIADVDAFFSGLTEGDFKLGPVEFDLTPKLVVGERGFAEKQEFKIEDFFSFHTETDLSDLITVNKLTIDDWLTGSEISVETIYAEGVKIEQKIKMGDVFEADFVDENGLVSLKMGPLQLEGDNTADTLLSQRWGELQEVANGMGLTVSQAIQVAFEESGAAASEKLGAVLAEWGVPEWVASFDWSTYVPTLTWSEFVSNLTWDSFVKVLQWTAFVNPLQWFVFVSRISWSSFVPDVDWSRFIPWLGGGSDDGDSGSTGGDGPQWSDGTTPSGPGFGAVGKGFTTARTMMVGETGPELVNLPRGSQIHSAGQTAQMAMGGVTVNVAATVNNEQDAYVLARQVANILQRGY